jgi:hypothetical protein
VPRQLDLGPLARAAEAGDRAIAGLRSRSDIALWRAAQQAQAVAWGDRPPPRQMTLRRWRPMRRNTLCGFADIELPFGLQIDDIAVHVRAGRAWASLPARPMLDQDGRHVIREGKPQYVVVLRWRSRELADKFSAAVVELVRRTHPDALDAGRGQ